MFTTYQPYQRQEQCPHKGRKNPVCQIGQYNPWAHHTGIQTLGTQQSRTEIFM